MEEFALLTIKPDKLPMRRGKKRLISFINLSCPTSYSQSLHYIMSKVGVHKKDARLFVCPLDELLHEICLSSKSGKEAGATTKQVAHIQLQKDTSYIWMDGLKCAFHSSLPDDRDVTNEHCARALSMTHAFRFLAVACVAHDVEMIRGVHFHVVDETDSKVTIPDDWHTQAEANNAAPDALLVGKKRLKIDFSKRLKTCII